MFDNGFFPSVCSLMEKMAIFPKNLFFLKPNILDFSFYGNANVVLIEKSRVFFLLKSPRLLQKKT